MKVSVWEGKKREKIQKDMRLSNSEIRLFRSDTLGSV